MNGGPGQREPCAQGTAISARHMRGHGFRKRRPGIPNRALPCCVSGIQKIGSEHKAKMRRIVTRKSHIAMACGGKAGAGIGSGRQGGYRIPHRMRQAQVSFGGEACQQAAQIAEMWRGSGMGNASTSGAFPEADSIRPGRQNNIRNGIQQRTAERAMVVLAPGLEHGRHGTTMLCDELLDNGNS